MASRVDVINRALQHHGAKRVTTKNQTPGSQEVEAMFDSIRDKELTNNIWGFSIKRASLAASATAPEYGYDLIYPTPTDFLRLVEIQDHPDYLLEQAGIVTSVTAPLKIRYIERVTNEGLFPALFVELLAASLAVNATESLKASADDKTRMMNAYDAALGEAVRTNAIQLPPTIQVEDEWITSRI